MPLVTYGENRCLCGSEMQESLEARVGIELLMVLKTKELPLESAVLPDEDLNIRRGLAHF